MAETQGQSPGPAEREYQRYLDASLRFDYFLGGLATGVLAYSVQSFNRADFPVAGWLAIAGWVALVICVLSILGQAFFRVESLRSSTKSILTRYGSTSQRQRDQLEAEIERFKKRSQWMGWTGRVSFGVGFLAITILKSLNW